MYNQPETILEKYPLSVEEISRGRGSYICKTAEGMKILLPFGGSRERAEFMKKYLAFLGEKGFETEQIETAADGCALVEDDRTKRYIVKSLLQGSECSVRKREDMRQAAALLGRYHRIAQESELFVPEFLQNGMNGVQICRKHIRELIQVKNYIRNHRKKKDFEREFTANFDYFMEGADRAVEQMEKISHPLRLICHGNYNQHNVIRTNTGWRMVNFEHLSYDSPMSDLATFLRKMMEKNNWKTDLGRELIGAYEKERSLSVQERELLGNFLLFPEKFWKIANHYNRSHKAWLSGRDLEKLQKFIAQEEARRNFLADIPT